MLPSQSQDILARARSFVLAGEFSRAVGFYETAARHWPNRAGVWHEYGNAAAKARQFEVAERAWNKAIALEPHNSELIASIGHQFQAIRKPEQARAFFTQAAAVDPRSINARISLAVFLERANRFEEARAAVQECLAIDPHDEQARYFNGVLDRRAGKLGEAEKQFRDLVASDPRHPYVRYAARYELAHVCDRTERYDDAMRLLGEAKQIVSQITDTSALLRSYDQTAESARRFTASQPKDIVQTWAKYFPERKRSAIPPLAFLGGHPRSGTTLLEQILDAHPGVAALDEPDAFLEVLQPAFHKTTEHSSQRLNILRGLYINALQQELGPAAAGKLLIDKNPSPTARLPVWLRVFPELRVIIALRDPCDVVLSCYFQNIPLNATNVNFLSLDRTAKHYSDLMNIWLTVRSWMGFAWLETRYEDVVANISGEGRRVTEFLGLDWHAGQERFYEGKAGKHLFSPTYQDVAQPVYQRSVARWRSYEKHLQPVMPALELFRKSFGYA